ncbi:DUF350 domain-containing protein [Motilibacter aurantiacus]|uniref:DUF350 domain-containing protein n=1 Tax=Motilibacter aurantiacus TaxID=2714955 RepID=UPI001408EC60|nr:DUF350 domain-containing protein [Motilibacter aurantiacus]NHC47548.1 DUF350 domain-containing protein [Motilibacter aurantiacus]
MLESLGYALAYTGVGLVMLYAGFLALDLLTPGKLSHRIWGEGSVNAAVVSAAGTLGLGGIVFTAIWTNAESGFGDALWWTIVFGLVGVALQSVAFVLLDLVTPGKLGAMVCERAFVPGTLVVAASQLAVSLIVIASIA